MCERITHAHMRKATDRSPPAMSNALHCEGVGTQLRTADTRAP
jgi:hypothetical protein